MRYASFMAQNRLTYGVAVERGMFDLGARFGAVAPDLKSYLAVVAGGLVLLPQVPTTADYGVGEFSYLPVIPNPDKILCVGLNYESHRKETGRPEASYPSIFTRFADSLVAHEAEIVLPKVSTALDYEGELAIVIGGWGFRVQEAEASRLVAGYTCFNDATLRDWQRHTHQFIPGKNFPGTGAFGPDLVTEDEVGDILAQPIETRLNGVVVQSAVIGDMIFSIPRIIAYVSSFTYLKPGDVIATGTPGGVGFKREPPLYMKPGDIVEVHVGGIGRLSNAIKAER